MELHLCLQWGDASALTHSGSRRGTEYGYRMGDYGSTAPGTESTPGTGSASYYDAPPAAGDHEIRSFGAFARSIGPPPGSATWSQPGGYAAS